MLALALAQSPFLQALRLPVYTAEKKVAVSEDLPGKLPLLANF